MNKKKTGVGSLSLLLVLAALVWSYNIFGFCLGDKVLTYLNLPAWSGDHAELMRNSFSIITFFNGFQGTHYTPFYSLLLLLPAFRLAATHQTDLFAKTGKWLSLILILLVLVSPVLALF